MNVVASSLSKYVGDVAEMISGPLDFLEKRQRDGKEHVLGAIVFLMLSATLSAIVMEVPGSAKLPRGLDDAWIHYGWESFRYHVVPAILFVCLQTLVGSRLTHWPGFVSVYAHAFGAFLVVRSVVVTIKYSAGTPLPAYVEGIVYAAFMLLPIYAVTRHHGMARPIFAVATFSLVVNGYFVGLYQIATRPAVDASRNERTLTTETTQASGRGLAVDAAGAFEPITRGVSRAISRLRQPLAGMLGDGSYAGTLAVSDLPITGDKYQDTWTLRGEQGEAVRIEASSGEFDTYLMLKDPEGDVIAEDDDGNYNGAYWTDSRIEHRLPVSGEYKVVVTSYEPYSGGDYAVTVTRAEGDQ